MHVYMHPYIKIKTNIIQELKNYKFSIFNIIFCHFISYQNLPIVYNYLQFL